MNKNRFNYRKLILLVLVLFISVGFAYLTSNLQINGVGHLKRTTWNIFFDNVKILQGNNLVVTKPTTNSNHTTTELNYSINFETPGEVFSFEVDIVNESTLDALITVLNESTLDASARDFATYTIEYDDGSQLQKNDLLKKMSYDTIIVTVTYRKDIEEEDLLEQEESVNFTLELEYQQANKDLEANERENKRIIEDLSGNGNYAKVYGATFNTDGTVTTDGIDDYILVGKIDFNEGLTMIARVKINNLENMTHNYAIMSNAEGAGGGIFLRNTKKIDAAWFNLGMKGYSFAYYDEIINPNQWYTLALTVDRENIVLYINGEEGGSSPTGGNLVNSSEPITVAAEYNGNTLYDFAKLTISDILVYDKALTANQIKSNYSETISKPITTNLIRYYALNK